MNIFLPSTSTLRKFLFNNFRLSVFKKKGGSLTQTHCSLLNDLFKLPC